MMITDIHHDYEENGAPGALSMMGRNDMTTTDASFTPGPWEPARLSNGRLSIVQDRPMGGMLDLVAEVAIAPNEQANANLIAAAPDLLKALTDCLPDIKAAWVNSTDAGQQIWTRFGACHAAINKALGHDAS